jgi:hypothetical protein
MNAKRFKGQGEIYSEQGDKIASVKYEIQEGEIRQGYKTIEGNFYTINEIMPLEGIMFLQLADERKIRISILSNYGDFSPSGDFRIVHDFKAAPEE